MEDENGHQESAEESTTHYCQTPACEGRAIQQFRNTWIHCESGLTVCDPHSDPTVKAKPRSYPEKSTGFTTYVGPFI